ncbi:MAG: SIS domain-containing protein [Vallitaleaceae bacterium]|nr:SIS domain-containing protein [Vallitaleaceae bacterium]
MNQQQLLESVQNTWTVEANAIQELVRNIDQEVILELIKVFGDCKGKILISGCGTSAAAAKKIAHSLCCVERPASFLSPSDAVHGGLGVLQKEDILILISKGGNTQELINLIPACQSKGATLIGISENPESVIAKQAKVYLKVKVSKEPCPFNMLATASTLAVIAVFDAICIALMFTTNYTKEQFGIIHPGGAVGIRLLNQQN